MSNHHDPQWAAHINAEFPKFYEFYWASVQLIPPASGDLYLDGVQVFNDLSHCDVHLASNML